MKTIEKRKVINKNFIYSKKKNKKILWLNFFFTI